MTGRGLRAGRAEQGWVFPGPLRPRAPRLQLCSGPPLPERQQPRSPSGISVLPPLDLTTPLFSFWIQAPLPSSCSAAFNHCSILPLWSPHQRKGPEHGWVSKLCPSLLPCPCAPSCLIWVPESPCGFLGSLTDTCCRNVSPSTGAHSIALGVKGSTNILVHS